MITTHVYVGTSLDGFIARKDGSFDWLSKFADADAVDAYKTFMTGIDVIVLGRRTFESVLGFSEWPYERPVIILSRSSRKVPLELQGKVSFSTLGPRDLLEELLKNGYRTVYVDGGKVIQSFLAEDLIDELIIARAPVLIGDGIPLFGYLTGDLNFQHAQTAAYSNGLIRSYYTRQRPVQKGN